MVLLFVINHYTFFLDNHQPVTGLFAVIAMVIGFILAFFGIRLFRFVIGVTGFLLFALLGYVILINVHLNNYNFGANFDYVIGAGILLFGVGGAVLSKWLWKWILLGLGAFGAVSLALALFSGINQQLIPVWLRPVCLGLAAVIGAYLLHKFERPLIIFATTIVGSLLFAFGLDSFFATGFDLIILAIVSGSIDPTKIEIKEQQTLGMVIFWVGMTMLGIMMQARFVGKNVKSHLKN